ALANIRRFVFEERRWKLSEVVAGMRANWGLAPPRTEYETQAVPDAQLRQKFLTMRRAFLASEAKFGNGDPYVDEIARRLMDEWYACAKRAGDVARKAFLDDKPEARVLREMVSYPAPSLRAATDARFDLRFTVG